MVNPEWIKAFGDAGVELDGDSLISLASVGATPEMIAAIADAAGFALDADDDAEDEDEDDDSEDEE